MFFFVFFMERLLILSTARKNSILFSALWTVSPILVSVVGFFTFVMLGNVLTISIAFTVGGFSFEEYQKLIIIIVRLSHYLT